MPPVTDSELRIAETIELGAPALADVDRLLTLRDFTDETVTAFAAQPDVPRNLTLDLTDANSSVLGGKVVITGHAMNGNIITETFIITGAGGTQQHVGTKVFADVTSVVVSGVLGETGADDYTIGIGDVIGLPFPIKASNAIVKTYFAGAIVTPTIATGPYKSGVDVSASTYDGSKELRVIAVRGR